MDKQENIVEAGNATPQTEIVTEAIVAPPTEIDQTKVKLASDNLESFKKEIKTKLYALKADKELLDQFIHFIGVDAKWSGMEALGIEELVKTFGNMTGTKNGVIYLKNLEVSAIYHFLSKVEGTGKESADGFLRMIRSVNPAVKMVNADKVRVLQLEHELAAAENGIEVNAERGTEEEE